METKMGDCKRGKRGSLTVNEERDKKEKTEE